MRVAWRGVGIRVAAWHWWLDFLRLPGHVFGVRVSVQSIVEGALAWPDSGRALSVRVFCTVREVVFAS